MSSPLPVGKFYGRGGHRPKLGVCGDDSPGVVPFPCKSILSDPDTVRKVFTKQDDLLNYTRGKKLTPFVFESKDDGRRFFMASDPRVFWHYDTQRQPQHRHTYEVIREYANCKLYFDLEFDALLNPDKDGVRMVRIFVGVVMYFLKKIFGVECGESDVLNLDSTTSGKFSRHLIFLLPDAVFRDNYNVGNFVKFVCEKITNLAYLKIVDSKGRENLFCDTAVYSKNRHFRLYKSTKYNKTASLELAADNKFNRAESELEVFLCSLITYTEGCEGFRVLEFGNAPGNPKLGAVSRNPVHREPSPFPQIDRFVANLVLPGHIYRSSYFPTRDTIVYDIVGNRFCGNVGRQHKSNNIKYVFDLSRAVYCQKCHDPDCSDYKSEDLAIPAELIVDRGDGAGVTGERGVASDQSRSLQRFPSFGLTDSEILGAYNSLDYEKNDFYYHHRQ
ncbi:hypothetical protein AAG570_005323 [Ranatra chinensis]|uniref:DNA-directed primase/polymerase protein n=1 Tax=Ranatra chinensis TaxID=642074 RepID=A0ABD0YIC7_9HEMI